ncbi:MAG: MBL fold metallo-hydrolase [Methanomassiliicoccaceae archaeon]|jgi:7,8-dihydropterin-6-yl-methyl-4-(beta-D-ribofuranosyl)aminobenzene 5'-phosphate synthase|nr:MBL fold metallo-hydrolase [Methanomassiliicoccaceae archaeon]
MKAKVLCVYDEGAVEKTSLIGARGLSILIDVDDERTLFDTGMRGNYLLHNMDFLEADPNTVDRVVLSHLHREHTGGLPSFLERRNEKVSVLMPPEGGGTEKPGILGMFRREGMPKLPAETASKMNASAINEWTKLSEKLYLTGPLGGDGVNEVSIVLMTRNGPVLICGCCHNGILNTMNYVKERTGKGVTAVVGGIHTTGMKRKEVHAIAETLKDNGPPMLYLNHCTGVAQRTYLREKLGLSAVKEFYAGTEIRFDV